MKDLSTKMEKYLFLYLKTGGGHISTAKALERYFQKAHPESVEVVLADGFQEVHPIVDKVIVDGYAKAQSYGKKMYEFLYLINKSYLGAKINQLVLSFFAKKYLKKLIQKEKPDKIVVFHFFLIKPVIEVLKKLKIDIPVVIIVTDPFTGTRSRFLEQQVKYLVFSERIKKYAISLGVENVQAFPPILDEKYASKLAPEEVNQLKKKLGFAPDKKIILLLGSGDGLPKGENILKELKDIGVQVAIVCGRNKKLFAYAEKLKKANPSFNLKVYGFIDFVYDMISIADIVITKGGPAGILEILMLGKIPLIHTYMREQEKGNVEFVIDNKVGHYEKDIKKLTQIAKKMLDGDLSEYQDAIKKLNLKIGTHEIAEYLIQIK